MRGTRKPLIFEPIKAVPVRHWSQWVIAAIIVLFLADFVHSLVLNEKIHWPSFGEYLFRPDVLSGVVTTLQLAVICMVLGSILGTLLAVAKLSSNKLLQTVANAYIWFFRGMPLLVLILICGNWGIISETIGISVPFTDIELISQLTRHVVTPFGAAVVALSLHEAAYMAEVVRGGIISVDRGQSEAAQALGMTDRKALTRIVLPQAGRIIVPPTGNQFITLVKSTALVEVIAAQELMTAATTIAYNTYRVMEALFVAAFWYLIIIAVLSVGQHFLEKHFGKGQRR
ncbi:amino acid ABC transporter permease [Homoserinimonas sp. A520]